MVCCVVVLLLLLVVVLDDLSGCFIGFESLIQLAASLFCLLGLLVFGICCFLLCWLSGFAVEIVGNLGLLVCCGLV